LVLGFDSNWQYREYNLNPQGRDMVILVGSDGVWEAENDEGERFGRERVKKLMSENAHLSSAEITTVITREVTRFRGKIPQADDITLVVVKMDSGQ
jgi:sigma-B regulation protein RsbU (phosphoserine phosphatase)